MEDNKQTSPDEIIVDSRLGFQAAIAGTAAPPVITGELCLLGPLTEDCTKDN
jgi:hypothetical protein